MGRSAIPTVSLLFVSTALAGQPLAQWMPTGGPPGGEVITIRGINDTLLAGTINSTVRSTDNGATWTAIDEFNGIPGVTQFVAVGDRMIAADFFGNVFASDDEGVTWIDLPDPAPGDVPVASHVDGGAIYLVTLPVSDPNQGSLWKSIDAGKSWTEIELPETSFGPHGAESIFADGDLLLVGSPDPFAGGFEPGVLRSTDGGENWDFIQNGINPFSFDIRPIISVGDTLLAGSGAGVYRSTNNGLSWSATLVGTQIADLQARDGVVFATGFTSDPGGGVWRSTDAGATWTPFVDGLPQLDQDPNTVFSSGGRVFLGGAFFSLYSSPDDAADWSRSNDGIAFANIFAMSANVDAVYAGIGGRQEIWRRENGAGDWIRSELPVEQGFAFGQVYSIHADEDGKVLVGTQGDGIFRSLDGAQTFQPINAGVPTYNGTAGTQRREIAAFAGSGETIFAGTGVGIEFINGTFVFTGGGAIRTMNGGDSWTTINNGLPIIGFDNFGQPVFDPIECMIHTDEVLLAGHFLGSGIYRSANDGASWSTANQGLPQGGSPPLVSDFASFEGAIYAAGLFGDVGLVRTTNGAVSWEPAAEGLPAGVTMTRLVATSNALFVGTEFGGGLAGMYVSTDGETWSPAGEALAGVAIRSLTQRAGRVFAGTGNRSVWILNATCEGDANGDGVVNTDDLLVVLAQYGQMESDLTGDIDTDGDVDIDDLLALLAHFGTSCADDPT
jgi:photosystem II stability/assembly factor-like uncharacterized protein